jgi:hypothetical protein
MQRITKEVTMAYTLVNYKTKKALKADVRDGVQVRCFQPGLGPDLFNYTGSITLEGPHYPEPHRWYAAATLLMGVVVKVK